jgi:hypothetical protein
MITTDPRSSLARLGRIGAVALCAATVAACGGSTPDTVSDAADRASKARDGALKFAQCMREHGVDMPDPKVDASGRVAVTLTGGPKSGNAEADLEAAQKECGKFMEDVKGDPPDAATQAKQQDAMLAFARCMREHGVDMPDPEFSSSGGRMTSKIRRREGAQAGTGDGPDSPRFNAADEACRPLLDDVGPGRAAGPAAAAGASGAER